MGIYDCGSGTHRDGAFSGYSSRWRCWIMLTHGSNGFGLPQACCKEQCSMPKYKNNTNLENSPRSCPAVVLFYTKVSSKVGLTQKIEALQRTFTARLAQCQDINYWERLKSLKLLSLQKAKGALCHHDYVEDSQRTPS